MAQTFSRTQILLDPEQHRSLQEIARRERRSFSDVVREMLTRQLAERKQQELASAAQALLADYQSDTDLTAFTALDGEDFHAQG
jgi:predicted CopG family antitoxin